MKKSFLLILLYFNTATFLFAQYNTSVNKKTATFCKIWGFLKYYHPKVASGKLDWDKEFITRIDSLDEFNSKQSLSNFYIRWLTSLGTPASCKKCKEPADSLKFNLNISWLKDTSLFANELIELFQHTINNRNI
ncbi:MAG: hypothetical protein IT249_18195, partial [Chitinophagaceae bacterium]|nr:hypothetical protein [Chitinophagaceae bacterium]